MNNRVKILNPGNRQTGQVEFEQEMGNAAAVRSDAPGVFGVLRPPAAFAKGAPKAAPVGTSGVRLLRVFFNLTGGAQAQLVLQQAAGFRSFCTIRNGSTSAGSVMVGFGFPPLGVETCDYELTPGQVLFLDYRVPQDDVWVYSAVGAFGNVSYSINRRGR